jgi:hypothetical protein
MKGNKIEITFHVLGYVRLRNVVFAPNKTAFTSPFLDLLSNDFFGLNKTQDLGFHTNLHNPTAACRSYVGH